jgi:hypothetical protein
MISAPNLFVGSGEATALLIFSADAAQPKKENASESSICSFWFHSCLGLPALYMRSRTQELINN